MVDMIYRWFLALVLAGASATAFAADPVHGRSLYDSTCNSCHGSPPAGGAATAPNDPARIKAAINGGQPAMSFMRGMYSDADLADIAAYIASAQGIDPPPSGPPVPAFNYSDLWWNPTESGWGFNIIQHPSNVIFAVVYTYIAPNRPMWFVMPGGAWSSPSNFSGKLYRVTGSPGNAAFRGGDVVEVGIASIAFNGANDAVLTYSVDGATVAKSITRQPF